MEKNLELYFKTETGKKLSPSPNPISPWIWQQ